MTVEDYVCFNCGAEIADDLPMLRTPSGGIVCEKRTCLEEAMREEADEIIYYEDVTDE